MRFVDKNQPSDLAVFGGAPLFDSPRPIGQLASAPVSDFLVLLKEIYNSRRLTNGGPMVERLEEALCAYHEVRNCVAVANAALGLTMLMQLFADGRHGEVIMPAFSYRGLPHFASWAGQKPRFGDVDEVRHTLDPVALPALLDEKVTSILSVCNFNSPGSLEELASVAYQAGLPLILDSVYGLGCTYRGKRLGGFANAEVYSLHATKLLNGFEGGYITTNDDSLALALRWQRNFTLPAHKPRAMSWEGSVLGTNAKLNELHAAMALLSLQRIDEIVDRNRDRYEAYSAELSSLPGLELIPYEESAREDHTYQMAVVRITEDWPLTRDQTLRVLRAEGAAVAAYYSPPLHRSEHCPPGVVTPSLPVSEALARCFCQLPVGEMVGMDDIQRIGDLFRFLHSQGNTVAAMLKENST